MADVLRLIDAAVAQHEEPHQCGWCDKPLTGAHPSLYFCSWCCQRSWFTDPADVVSPRGEFWDFSRVRSVPDDSQVRYPEGVVACNSLISLVKTSDYLDSLQLWMTEKCDCSSCFWGVVAVLSGLGRPVAFQAWELEEMPNGLHLLVEEVTEVIQLHRVLVTGQPV